jgi:hypothetical protein
LKLAGDFDLWANFFQYADLYAVSSPLGGFRMHGNQKSLQQIPAYIEEAKLSLSRHGGHPYGKFESAIRRFLHLSMMGNREMSRNNLPPLLASIIKMLPIFYPVKLCTWTSEGWQLGEGYIV